MNVRWIAGVGALLAVFVWQPAAAQGDITVPVVVTMTLSPGRIDTDNEPQTIVATARITDDLSGLVYVQIELGPQGTTQRTTVWFRPENLISGDTKDGIYQTTITLPQFAAWGWWSPFFFGIGDLVGNSSYWGGGTGIPQSLIGVGFTIGPLDVLPSLFLPIAFTVLTE